MDGVGKDLGSGLEHSGCWCGGGQGEEGCEGEENCILSDG